MGREGNQYALEINIYYKSLLNRDDGGTMRKVIALIVFLLLPLIVYGGEKEQGENSTVKNNQMERAATTMVENRDGELKPNEYEVISTNGAITRAFCPYTCAMRGLETKHCKTWRSSNDPKLCYVQDTRLKTNAIKWEGVNKGK
jgi:hypothetical protein